MLPLTCSAAGIQAVRADRHLIELRGELQSLGAGQSGVDRWPAAHATCRVARGRRELVRGAFRQWRQRLRQGRQRRDSQAIGLQLPTVAVFVVLDEQARLAPTRFTQVEAELIDQQPIATLGALGIGGQGQIVEVLHRVFAIGRFDPRRIEAQHRSREALLPPAEPGFATRLHAVEPPVGGQLLRQPGRPVTLRQAQINVDRCLLPALGLQLRPNLQRRAADPSGNTVPPVQAQVTDHRSAG